ncbi:hypothetical protein ACM64Y_04185 [Novispirillum sp. DQ9]|uniref:hypothetical protein n=1 Tax=Novispirillum sp. DQ9 TaxID=3398612 RepID=UPI003C7BD2BB
MKAMVAVVLAAGLTAACTAEDPLARPLPQPTMPPPQSPLMPLPSYVQRLDKDPITVKVDPSGQVEMDCAGDGAANGSGEACR